MNSLSSSESALKKFAEKIDFAKLEGKPEDYYKAGLTFVENGQFDDGIIEFVKIIKTASHESVLFVNAVKELVSMGFSDADISAISGNPEAVKDIIINHFLAPSTPVASKSNNGISANIVIVIFIIIACLLLVLFEMFPEDFKIIGDLIYGAIVLGPPLIILIYLIVYSKKK